MAKPIPSAQDVAEKWAKNAGNATDEYVKNAKASTWKAEAVKGSDNFKKAMATVIAKDLQKKGIEKSSDAEWQTGIETNKDRYSSGVTAAKDDMAEGMTPVLNDIKTAMATLGERGVKGSAQNYDRSKKLGTALHDAAEKRSGA